MQAFTVSREIFAGAVVCKLCQDSSEQTLAVFIFAKRMHDAMTTHTPVDDHAPHANPKK